MAYESNLDTMREVVRINYETCQDAHDNPSGAGDIWEDFHERFGRYPAWQGYVCVYERTQASGGPEEGGWWRDVYTPIAAMPVTNLEGANLALMLLDTWARDQYADERPYYSAAGGVDAVLRFEREYPMKAEMYPEGAYE